MPISRFPDPLPTSGATDHGALTGLADDDHTQYLLADGTRTLSGNLVVTGTVDGRDVATDGSKLDGIESGADVTDATNVTAAGAVMESDYSSPNSIIRRTHGSTVGIITASEETICGRPAGATSDVAFLTATQTRTILNVEDGSQANDVDSVFGRTGAVVAATSDYDADQVDYDNSDTGLAATNVQDAIDQIVHYGLTCETLKRSGWIEHFDFDNSVSSNFNRSLSGTGANCSVTSGTNGAGTSYGFAYMQTGTTTTGRAGIRRATSGVSFSGAAAHVSEWRLYVDIVPDATNDYDFVVGFGDDNTASGQTDGAYFLIDYSTSTTNWCIVTAQTSTRTTTATSTAIAARNWLRLTVVVASGGGTVDFYIDGVSVGQHTTNIPANSTTRMTSTGLCMAVKSAGTSNRVFNIDYAAYAIIRDSAIT